jgi:dihydrodipicolinate synthase/N-acetylneuraminate lyase
LRGLVGLGVTPFHKDFSLNLEALRQNSDHLADFCDVIVPLGNNGEIFSLSPEEQRLVGRTVVEEVRDRKPVLVGVGYALPVVLELVKAAEAYGADGILVLPPAIMAANDGGLVDYYRTIAASTKLGIVLFQTPTFNFSLGLLRRLREVPNIVGMKDERGDMKQFVRQWRAASDRLELLCGVGEILAPVILRWE